MKITSNNRILNLYTNNNVPSNQSLNRGKKEDKIEISSVGREISKWIETAKSIEVTSNKVEEIKNRIDSGTYKVSAEDLAKSILDAMKGRE